MIHRAGGIAVWAHPGLLDLREGRLEGEIVRFASMGLDGVEAHYPEHSPATTAALLKLANRHRLAVSGGTDFHGEAKPDTRLGSLPVPASLLIPLRAKRPGISKNSDG